MLDAGISLLVFALVVFSRPALSPAARSPARVGTRVAVLAAEEASFGVWRGRDVGGGGALSHGARLSLAFEPSEGSQVQLFVRRARGRVREVRLVSRGDREQAPAPGQSLVYVGGLGDLLLRVCPRDTERLSPATGPGQQVLQAALDAPGLRRLLPARRTREGAHAPLPPGWQTRLPDGTPVEVTWRWFWGRGCQWAGIPLAEAPPGEGPSAEAGVSLDGSEEGA